MFVNKWATPSRSALFGSAFYFSCNFERRLNENHLFGIVSLMTILASFLHESFSLILNWQF